MVRPKKSEKVLKQPAPAKRDGFAEDIAEAWQSVKDGFLTHATRLWAKLEREGADRQEVRKLHDRIWWERAFRYMDRDDR